MQRRITILSLALLAFACLRSLSSAWADDVEEFRRRHAGWKKHPDQLARLRDHWQRFQALPEERQAAIVRLDGSLHEETSTEQARLETLMRRYADWVEHLLEADRQALMAAPLATRLALVRSLRDREWLQTQPRGVRDEAAKQTGPALAMYVQKLRHNEQRRRDDWTVAARFWKELETKQPLPARLADFRDAELTSYVNDFLKPLLSPAEKERLTAAEGSWPAFPRTLVELADAHPAALPGPVGPRSVAELPPVLANRLKKLAAIPRALRDKEGAWPAFGSALIEHLRGRRNISPVFPHEIWASSAPGLETPMKDFVFKKLVPLLSIDEKLRLSAAEGLWPDYPLTIQVLAQTHALAAPWFVLPGSRERWESYRLHHGIKPGT